MLTIKALKIFIVFKFFIYLYYSNKLKINKRIKIFIELIRSLKLALIIEA